MTLNIPKPKDKDDKWDEVGEGDCVICCDAKACYYFDGCGHLCSCENCAKGDKCFMCNAAGKAIKIIKTND